MYVYGRISLYWEQAWQKRGFVSLLLPWLQALIF